MFLAVCQPSCCQVKTNWMSKRLVGFQKNNIETLESFSMEIDLEIDHATLTLRHISGITVFHGLWLSERRCKITSIAVKRRTTVIMILHCSAPGLKMSVSTLARYIFLPPDEGNSAPNDVLN